MSNRIPDSGFRSPRRRATPALRSTRRFARELVQQVGPCLPAHRPPFGRAFPAALTASATSVAHRPGSRRRPPRWTGRRQAVSDRWRPGPVDHDVQAYRGISMAASSRGRPDVQKRYPTLADLLHRAPQGRAQLLRIGDRALGPGAVGAGGLARSTSGLPSHPDPGVLDWRPRLVATCD